MVFLALGALAVPAVQAADSFPDHPIRIVVPYAPGGGVDVAGRLLAQHMGSILKQQVIVENRAGGAGVIGTTAVIGSPPDGYNLLLISMAIVTNPSLIKNVPYDASRDLRAVSMVGSSPLVLTVNAKVPVHDVPSLIAYAKARPGTLNYSTAGVGTTTHLAAELLRAGSGIDITGVAYKGSGPAMTDLVSGQVQMSFSSIAAAQPFIATGALRPLATTGLKRDASMPDLPAMAEYIPGFQVDLWMALFAPAGTPAPVVKRLNEAVVAALHDPELREGFEHVGQEATGSTPEDAQKFVQAEQIKWTKVIRDAKIEAD
jgi:tripartite-type tricarboxylate transporter receptor subunit TctC